MVHATNLGFPRMGANRDLKKLVENHWSGKIDERSLLIGAKNLRAEHWKIQQAAGVADGHIPCNDFSFYDQVLDHLVMFDAVPQKYRGLEFPLETYFAMGRGLQRPEKGIDVPAMEMKKWFDTNCKSSPDPFSLLLLPNKLWGGLSICSSKILTRSRKTLSSLSFLLPSFTVSSDLATSALTTTTNLSLSRTPDHFIVPDFTPEQAFTLRTRKPIDEFLEAKALGIITRPTILGPISLLRLGKTKSQAFDPMTLLDRLLPVYVTLIAGLAEAGAAWVQIDEPILSHDLPAEFKEYFAKAYNRLSKVSADIKILLVNYFGRLGENISIVDGLPIAGLHVDLVRAPEELDAAIALAKKNGLTLSMGVIDGRNVWKANLEIALTKIHRAVGVLGNERVLVAPSCSLLHTPHSLEAETAMSKDILDWLSFAVEKLHEINVLVRAVNEGETVAEVVSALEANSRSMKARKSSALIHNPQVRSEMQAVTEDMYRRRSAFPHRHEVQQERLQLPIFPTTTVGSFPQTKVVRVARQKLKKGDLTEDEYVTFIRAETDKCIHFQEQIGLDVLVHGEFERNDMVEYFGEQLEGYVFSGNGWVQSYGSRCVKPPILFGDVSRPQPMTVEWSTYAQSKTSKPMKGMLTGPVTMLQWSFVRDDQPRRDTAQQLALAIRKEVLDLEAAGIPVIQIDEPAIREGLPLRRSDWEEYLKWAARAFLLSSTGVRDETQIHTHMCYSDFNDIFPTIQSLDADAITIENSKSDLKLLTAFERHNYTNGIGPGLYDIHSPRVPSVDEMKERLGEMLKYLKKDLVWVNPDCGLKTRGWEETERSLANMCKVAEEFRKVVKF
ncbi:methionine-synthesizing 5- methyltetrahydropteroyltriglutamate--homocysteine methyltransferase [Dinochytrium kinnereticum]|nr:methionine-synthesizing 5- methyltetrahydropteroyltriglutamate--homocysteine methyltransferase [Dinochytrium kinnereticum]